MTDSIRQYLLITGNYWAFTLTDGALRMLVVLYFHALGYTPLEIALLFLFYEFFGVVTNLMGGWLAAHIGLTRTMQIGTLLQIIALLLLTVPDDMLSVPYVMAAQAMSGIAKDLNKMSAKSSVKSLVSAGRDSRLFKWVAVLTGSKNTLKGAGFFLGGFLLATLGFRNALYAQAGLLVLALLITLAGLNTELGKTRAKPKFSQLFSKSKAINVLSGARFFLFGARDIWFVVALPVYLSSQFGWGHSLVGGFLAAWVIGYGFVQASAPRFIRHSHEGRGPDAVTAQYWVFLLTGIPAVMAVMLDQGANAQWVVIVGLMIFGILFAMNSAVHSYLILAYSEDDKVALDVGFYYMANAGGRLAGTVISGWSYQSLGLEGCLLLSSGFLAASYMVSRALPPLYRDELKTAP